MTLKLELGKKYLNRRGEVVEIEYDYGSDCIHRYEDSKNSSYTAIGEFFEGETHQEDLISEYVEPSTKPVEISNKIPHLHADLIIAWAQGETIQFLDSGHWYDDGTPNWNPKTVYRIKPEKNIEVVTALVSTEIVLLHAYKPNLNLTFEDGKLIKAEVL